MPRSKNETNGLEIGEELGRFRITARLGRGAMGEVYLCRDESLKRDVAVKVLAEAHRHNSELRARFVREARAVARISHPNVVNIHFIDEHCGLPYFAMDYLKGRDLGSFLAQVKTLDPGEGAAVILRVARGLQAAANASVVHRDVKPANILVTTDRDVKLMDFGLAKTVAVDPELTAAGLVVGTPDYISPEQARGEPADSRSDVYGLGCTLFHVLAGQPPFRIKDGPNTYMAILGRHMHKTTPRVEEFRSGIDSDLASLCLRMMEKEPSARPSIDRVVEELELLENRIGAEVPEVKQRSTVNPEEASARGDNKDSWEQEEDSSDRRVSSRRTIGDVAVHTLVARTGLPGWSLVVTALAVAVFLIGLGLRLSGTESRVSGRPETAMKRSRTSGKPGEIGPDGGNAAHVDSNARGIGIPWKTVPVSVGDNRPRIHVAVRPVSLLDWSERGPQEPRVESGPDPRALLPITGVSFNDAVEFAKKHGGRLPATDEWRIITRAEGVIFPDLTMSEWVTGPKGRVRVGSSDGKTTTRRTRATYGDVTFRIVWETDERKP